MNKTIEDKLKELKISHSNFAFGKFPNPLSDIGEWEEVYLNDGELWQSVKHFKELDVYIKTTGISSSYNDGVEFYDGYGEEVKPATKTVTIYK